MLLVFCTARVLNDVQFVDWIDTNNFKAQWNDPEAKCSPYNYKEDVELFAGIKEQLQLTLIILITNNRTGTLFKTKYPQYTL